MCWSMCQRFRAYIHTLIHVNHLEVKGEDPEVEMEREMRDADIDA